MTVAMLPQLIARRNRVLSKEHTQAYRLTVAGPMNISFYDIN